MSRRGDTALLADITQQCVHVSADMSDAKAVEDIVAGDRITHIVHIAHLGAVLPSVSEVDPAQAVRLNVKGTANVLEAARRRGVKPMSATRRARPSLSLNLRLYKVKKNRGSPECGWRQTGPGLAPP
jgi:dTDP-D-glucose 4,6-dehydratase